MRGDLLAYYLVFSFLSYILVDYKYIYSFVDSKFLYITSGSKLNLETNKRKSKFFNIQDKLDIYIFIIFFIILFLIHYTLFLIICDSNPLIINVMHKKIDIRLLIEGYEKGLIITYHISALLCMFFLVNTNLYKIKNYIFKRVGKLITKKEETSNITKNDYILARDENDECVYISDEALYQNVLITGSIGAGKTSGAIARLTYNLIKSGKGGLILDVKGNYVESVKQMCDKCARMKDLVIISKNSEYYFELLEEDVSSLELASGLKRVIELLSTNNNSDPYWLDKVENVLMNLIILMKYTNTLGMLELHRLVTEDKYLQDKIKDIKQMLKNTVPDDKTCFELTNAIMFIQNEYLKLDQRVSGIIKSEITRLTIPLVTDFDTYNQFCRQSKKEKITFDNSKIVVLSINIGENKALTKIIATFLKLSFQKNILSKINSNKSTFFIADEFQEFCNSEDAHFLSLSREAKCINIVSTQSYSSIKNNLKDENAALVIIQNLVNKIWFRNDDNYTIGEIIKQLGKVNVIKENETISESGQESKKYILKSGFKNKKSSISKALNYVTVKENEYDENFFSRELKTFEALTFLVTGNGIITKKVIFERWK